jgi:hypothetical protein
MKRIALLAAVVALPALALAGTTGNTYVTISGSTAYGMIGSARHSPDTAQKLGCTLYTFSTWSYVGVSCLAVDATPRAIGCNTTTPSLVTIAEHLPSDGYLEFTVDASGHCTNIQVRNYSDNTPK